MHTENWPQFIPYIHSAVSSFPVPLGKPGHGGQNFSCGAFSLSFGNRTVLKMENPFKMKVCFLRNLYEEILAIRGETARIIHASCVNPGPPLKIV